jgi:FeS assembly SUF system protein
MKFRLFSRATSGQTEVTDAADAAASEDALGANIVAALRSVYDPEIPVNIYDLGLIYDIVESGPGQVDIRMTLTAPGCPVAGSLPAEVQRAVEGLDGVDVCRVELVWEPPWTQERMSEEARLALGMY